MFCVYVLYSARLNRFYVGTTDNIKRRLDEHNSLKYSDAFTSKGIPWELYYAIEDLSSGEAYWIEKKIKSNKSSKYIKNLKNYPEITQKLIETAKSLVQPR